MSDAAEQQEQHSPKPKSKLPFILGGFVILLLAIGAISMTLLGGTKKEASEVELKPTMKPVGYMYKIPESFTVNLAAPDDQSILSTDVTLEIEPKEKGSSEKKALEEALKELGVSAGGGGEGKKEENNNNKMPIITQIITDVLSSKTKAQVTGSQRERLRNEIKNKINAKLEKAIIAEIYMNPLVP